MCSLTYRQVFEKFWQAKKESSYEQRQWTVCLLPMVIPSETDFESFTSCLELIPSIRHQCWYLLPLDPPGWLHSYWNHLLSHVASSSLILKNYGQPSPGWSLIKRTKDRSQQWAGYSTKTCRYINGDLLIFQFRVNSEIEWHGWTRKGPYGILCPGALAHWICKSITKTPYTKKDSLGQDMFTLDSDPF